jgi:hypothetical protein
MSPEDFDKLVVERCDKIRQTLVMKSKEYSRNGDRLWNFNRGAAISGISRERALHGFMLKHFISYLDILDDIDKGNIPSNDTVDEKVGDIINYFILLEASIKERNALK